MTVNQVSAPAVGAPASSTRALLWAGVVGPIAFIAVFLVEGATRRGYDPVRHFVSLLSLGEGGWVQSLNFAVGGVAVTAFGLGLRRVWRATGRSRRVPQLVMVVGLALIASAVFSADPALGYPPGTSGGIPRDASLHGGLHYLAAVVVFLGLATAILLSARFAPTERRRHWAVYSILSATVLLSGWIGAFIATGPSGIVETAGLFQRIAIVAGWQWLVATAVIELTRRTRRRPVGTQSRVIPT